MRIIKQLAEYIEEEICDSEKYALMAMELKESYPEVANVMYMLSLEEMKHMQLLHE
jgi:ferritin